MTWPRVLEDYVRSLTLDERRPAFLIASADGRVIERGGDLELYGLTGLEPGGEILAHADCLEGLIPHHGGHLKLPFIETDSGCFADIHVGDAPEGSFVLFLDASEEVERESALQQRSNDLALLRELIASERSNAAAEERVDLTRGSDVLPEAVRCRLTILVVRLTVEPAEVGQELEMLQFIERCRREAAARLARQGALIDTNLGAGLVGLFGVLPSTVVAERAAVQAALDAFAAVAELELGPRSRPVGAAAGIASGEVILGAAARPRGPDPIVVGPAWELAERLARRARPGEMLVDEDTLEGTQGLQQDFEQVPGSDVPRVHRRRTGGRA